MELRRWHPLNQAAYVDYKVFLPGLGQWNNQDFQDEWKRVDAYGRLAIDR